MIIEINNKEIEAKPGDFLLPLLRREGIKVPTLCNINGLLPDGSCRLCVVEVDGIDGLVPSCATTAFEGMKIKTHSTKVMQARRTMIDLLLASHPDDCLYCIRNKECDLQTLAKENGITDRLFTTAKKEFCIDNSSSAIIYESSKCILCGKCIRVCTEIQGVSNLHFIKKGSKSSVGTVSNQVFNKSDCVYCGQCIMVCPTASLREKDNVDITISAIENSDKYAIVFNDSAVSITLGEEFGIKAGTNIDGAITTGLKNVGFDKVFDTSFASDIALIEQANELVERIRNGGIFPMFSSSCPSWIMFVEKFYPEYIPNLSTCKSPSQIMGSLIKTHYADIKGIDQSKIFNVSVSPCVASKYEIKRPEFNYDGISDIDVSLTTREIARMFKMRGIELNSSNPDYPDNPYNESSTASKLSSVSGGILEGLLRTVHYLLTGNDIEHAPYQDIRGFNGIKESKVIFNDIEIRVAVVSGLSNVRNLLADIKDGRKDFHFIEVRACSGGCIAGGGQPKPFDNENLKARIKSLYNIDKIESLRNSYNNKSVKRLYDEFLENRSNIRKITKIERLKD